MDFWMSKAHCTHAIRIVWICFKNHRFTGMDVCLSLPVPFLYSAWSDPYVHLRAFDLRVDFSISDRSTCKGSRTSTNKTDIFPQLIFFVWHSFVRSIEIGTITLTQSLQELSFTCPWKEKKRWVCDVQNLLNKQSLILIML